MSVLPPASGPRAALRDLGAFLRQRSREQVIAAMLSVLITIIILILFFVDSKINTAPEATVIFVEDFPANRSDEQIQADQAVDSARRKEAQLARQREFQKLENTLGIE